MNLTSSLLIQLPSKRMVTGSNSVEITIMVKDFMEKFIFILLGILLIYLVVLIKLKKDFSFSSILGSSVSSSGKEFFVSGKVLSVTCNGIVLLGDPSLAGINGNTIP